MDMDIWQIAEGKIVHCEKPYIHHIVERDDAEQGDELLYNLDNLITCTKASHEEIHYYYKTNKQYALDRIARGVAKFREIFGE